MGIYVQPGTTIFVFVSFSLLVMRFFFDLKTYLPFFFLSLNTQHQIRPRHVHVVRQPASRWHQHHRLHGHPTSQHSGNRALLFKYGNAMAFISNPSAIHEAQMTCAYDVICAHLPFFAIRDASKQELINNPGDQGVCRAERSQEREPAGLLTSRAGRRSGTREATVDKGVSRRHSEGEDTEAFLSGAGRLRGIHFKGLLSRTLT